MSGGVSALEMISRIRDNRRLAKEKREFFNKDILEAHKASRHGQLKDKKVSRRKLRKVKYQINERFRKERRTEYIIGVIVLILPIALACYLVF